MGILDQALYIPYPVEMPAFDSLSSASNRSVTIGPAPSGISPVHVRIPG